MSVQDRKKRIIFLLAEGIGLSSAWKGNAFLSANPQNFLSLWESYPHVIIEDDVTPEPINFSILGTGKNISSNQLFVNEEIKNKNVLSNEKISKAYGYVSSQKSSLHLIGSLSNEKGAYGNIDHLIQFLKLAKTKGIYKVYIHLVLDNSFSDDFKEVLALGNKLEKMIATVGLGEIASITGKKYIDEKSNIFNFRKAYNAIVSGKAKHALSLEQALSLQPKGVLTPADCIPTVISFHNESVGTISNFDAILFYNFNNDFSSKFALALSQKTPIMSGLSLPRFIKILSLFDSPKSEYNKIESVFSRSHQGTFPVVLAKNKISQLYISDSTRINCITNYLQDIEENSADNSFVYTSDNSSSYLSDYKKTLTSINNELIKSLEKNEFTFLDIPVIFHACHSVKFENIVKIIKLMDSFVFHLYNLAIKEDCVLIITSLNGISARLENTDKKTVLPFTVISKYIPKIASKSSSFTDTLVFDMLKNKFKLIDIAPSILDLFGIPILPSMEGKSIFTSI